MKNISISNRTTKSEGTIRLRFRLRDGRKVDLYHKSEIRATLDELSKFDMGTTQVKDKVRNFNVQLAKDIAAEVSIMDQAYSKMISEGYPMDCTTFESTINAIKNPAAAAAMNMISIDRNRWDVRFDQFIQDGLRDGIFGEARARSYRTTLAILRRFMEIFGYRDLKVKDVDGEILMQFRQYSIDEYLYVKDWMHLYAGTKSQNMPREKKSQNTIAESMRMLQTFFSELEDREEIDRTPFRKIGKERKHAIMRQRYDEPIYLKQAELETIMAAEVPAALKETRLAFILQCAFGCRISDFQALRMANVSISDEGIPFIHYLPKKTSHNSINNAEVKTPIMKYALEIIKDHPFDFKIIHYPSGEWGYNAKIRDLLKYCGIDRQCCEFNEETGENEYKPLWEFGSSKLARKTHVDMMSKVQVNLYAAGLHKAGSDAVNHYTSMGMRDRFVLMCVAFNQPQFKVDSNLNIIEG